MDGVYPEVDVLELVVHTLWFLMLFYGLIRAVSHVETLLEEENARVRKDTAAGRHQETD